MRVSLVLSRQRGTMTFWSLALNSRLFRRLAEGMRVSEVAPPFEVTARMALSGEAQKIEELRHTDRFSLLASRIEEAFDAPTGSIQFCVGGRRLADAVLNESLYTAGIHEGSELLCVRQPDPYRIYAMRNVTSHIEDTRRLVVGPNSRCALIVHRHGEEYDLSRGEKIKVNQRFIHCGAYTTGEHDDDIICRWEQHWSAVARRGWMRWAGGSEWVKVRSGPVSRISLEEWGEIADTEIKENPLHGISMRGWSSRQLVGQA